MKKTLVAFTLLLTACGGASAQVHQHGRATVSAVVAQMPPVKTLTARENLAASYFWLDPAPSAPAWDARAAYNDCVSPPDGTICDYKTLSSMTYGLLTYQPQEVPYSPDPFAYDRRPVWMYEWDNQTCTKYGGYLGPGAAKPVQLPCTWRTFVDAVTGKPLFSEGGT